MTLTSLKQVNNVKTMRAFSDVRSMLSSVRLSSVTFVRPSRLKFSVIFLRHFVSWPSVDIHIKFYGDRLRETPPSGGGEVNAAGCSDFGPIEGYISETVQCMR